MTETTKKPALIAYTVREAKGKSYWREIGVAFANSAEKGGYKIILDALPLNGELILLPPKPQEDHNNA